MALEEIWSREYRKEMVSDARSILRTMKPTIAFWEARDKFTY